VTAWTITVPGPPRGKGRPRFARVGNGVRTFTDSRTESFEALVALCARSVLPREMLEPPIAVEIVCVLPLPKSKRKLACTPAPVKPDLDNVIKTIDGLKAHFRDEHVTGIVASKRYAAEGEQPHTTIVVRTKEEEVE
jgi:Holliday junction resolvase RusA-like endonuclease